VLTEEENGRLVDFIYAVSVMEKFLALLEAVAQFDEADIKELRSIISHEGKDIPAYLKYIDNLAPDLVDHIEALMRRLNEMAIQSELNQHRN
jgi:hypothetical protein